MKISNLVLLGVSDGNQSYLIEKVFLGVQKQNNKILLFRFPPAFIKIVQNKTKQTNEMSNDNYESSKENQTNYGYIS